MNPAPIQPTLDLTALRAQLADADRFVAEEEAAYNHQIALAVLECCRRPPEPEFVFEQTVLAVGPLALAPFPPSSIW